MEHKTHLMIGNRSVEGVGKRIFRAGVGVGVQITYYRFKLIFPAHFGDRQELFCLADSHIIFAQIFIHLGNFYWRLGWHDILYSGVD